MTETQTPKALSPTEKQYVVLPNEADPKFSLPKAMAAALRAKDAARKIGKPI